MNLKDIPESRYDIIYDAVNNTISFILAGATKPNKDMIDRQLVYDSLLSALKEGQDSGLVKFSETENELYSFSEKIFDLELVKDGERILCLGKPSGEIGKLFARKIGCDTKTSIDLGILTTHAGLDKYVFQQYSSLYPSSQKNAVKIYSLYQHGWGGNILLLSIQVALSSDEIKVEKSEFEKTILPVPNEIQSWNDFINYCMVQASSCYLIEQLSAGVQ